MNDYICLSKSKLAANMVVFPFHAGGEVWDQFFLCLSQNGLRQLLRFFPTPRFKLPFHLQGNERLLI